MYTSLHHLKPPPPVHGPNRGSGTPMVLEPPGGTGIPLPSTTGVPAPPGIPGPLGGPSPVGAFQHLAGGSSTAATFRDYAGGSSTAAAFRYPPAAAEPLRLPIPACTFRLPEPHSIPEPRKRSSSVNILYDETKRDQTSASRVRTAEKVRVEPCHIRPLAARKNGKKYAERHLKIEKKSDPDPYRDEVYRNAFCALQGWCE